LEVIGCEVTLFPGKQQFSLTTTPTLEPELWPTRPEIQDFLAVVTEELFTIQYFWQVPISTISSVLYRD
jgi:hypothetical protein